jgi:hypothetical protein
MDLKKPEERLFFAAEFTLIAHFELKKQYQNWLFCDLASVLI